MDNTTMIDRPRARTMMAESEAALRPVLERVKELVPEHVWAQYEDGLMSGVDLIRYMFELLNPPNENWTREKHHPHD